MATIAAYVKTGLKYVQMTQNPTSTLRGKTYTTKPQDRSNATVSYTGDERTFCPIYRFWHSSSIVGCNVPISKAITILGQHTHSNVDALLIKQEDEIIYEVLPDTLKDAELSAKKVKAYLELYVEGGLTCLPNDLGKKYPNRPRE